MKLETLKKDCFYHIYNRGNNGDDIFKHDENYQYFLQLLDKYLITGISVFAYCLLKNHYHLLIRIEEEHVTQRLSNLFNAYAKAFNKATARTGSLFEKHFKRIKLHDEAYLRNLIIYIHANPQHHRIIDDFRNYNFSSYQIILSTSKTTVKRKEVIELFKDVENFEDAHMQKNQYLTQKYNLEE